VSGQIAPVLGRVVVGVDFSRPALSAAEWVARDFAPEAELVLAYAIEVAESPEGEASRPEAPAPDSNSMRGSAAERLSALANSLGGRVIRTHIVNDRPATALATLATQCGADLIVVGPYSDRPNPFGRFGSTADRLVRISPVSVLVAAGSPRGRPRHLLVPVDDVDLAAVAIEWAKVLSRRHSAGVTLMHILDERWQETYARVSAVRDGDNAPFSTGWSPGSIKATAESWLASLAEQLPPPAAVQLAVETGVPGPEIVTAARRTAADLIVMGRRGVGHAPPSGIGSTASIALRGAPCPVLVAIERAEVTDDSVATSEVA
jgi:nucleotide-binding universal stress UspA family protein